MDTSDKYIKMCEKAEEIQGIRSGFSSGYLGEIWLNDGRFQLHRGKVYVGLECTWLPRQDQLQEMVDCHKNIQIAHHRLYQVTAFWSGRDLQSMEQLWLAFVMREKYGKVWDGWESIWIQPTTKEEIQ